MGWFLLVWELARSGVFEGTRVSGHLVEIAIILVPLAVGFAGEALPAWLALPIGVGDSVLGLTAPWVAGRARAGASGLGALRLWNVIGAAIALYTIAAPVASAHATGYFFSLYPLVLFPTFLAPSYLLLHLAGHRAQ